MKGLKEHLSRIYRKSKKDYYELLNGWLEREERKFIVTVNPESLMMAKNDIELNTLLSDENTSLVPDGIAVVKACRMGGLETEERITGVEIAEYLLCELDRQKRSLYLFGARPEVIEKLKEVIKEKYPNIALVGCSDGYVSDKDKVFEEIASLKPDVCLVALGIPVQEKLIYKHLDKFEKGIFVGVGGSFDVISGTKKRAPEFFIKCNLEWLYRIAKEPKRLKRFYNSNVKFIFAVKKEFKKG
ncbi:MAG: WecB/TagA/CpsF family glycosyltransferase [Clostridia bacterium]|nr:WecB/TagA/CpsF family glycosyltransferase [Clostridia bacterium]